MALIPTRARPPSSSDATKRARLQRAQRLALGFLVAATLAYIGARLALPGHPWLHYVAAFSEASMVGALADWFAVVALFRHPMGVRLPHTAIIPRNKARIAATLGDFIQSRFLTSEKIEDGIRKFTPGRRLAKWVSRPANAARLLDLTRELIARVVASLDRESVRLFVKDTAARQLGRWDTSALVARVLRLLTESGRHQALLDEALTQLSQFLQHEDVREELVRAIARHMEFVPSTLNLDERLGRAIFQRLYEALQTVLDAVRSDRDHVLRRRFDAAVIDLCDRLQNDAAFRSQLSALQAEWACEPATQEAIGALWEDVRCWLDDQARDPRGALTEHLAAVIRDFAQAYARRTRLHLWVDRQLAGLAAPLVAKYGRSIGLFITAQVEAWNDAFMVDQIELSIGRDLQFIRLNGTLVGGFVGLVIYTASQLWH